MGLDMYLDKVPKNTKPEYFNYNTEEIGSWHKANVIHNWFVKYIQNGVDDCNNYLVPKEKIKELLNTCIEVITSSSLIPDKYEMVIKDTSVAKELLPAPDGWIYGHYYLYQIKQTIDILLDVFEIVDFDKEDVWYYSSW